MKKVILMKSIDAMIVQPSPVFMIGTYDENGTPDVMNAAWAAQCGPKHVTINFALNRQTLENIKNNKEFTVAYATKDTLVVSDYFGIVSAALDADKVKNAGVTVVKSENINAPIVEEYPITLECKLIDMQEIIPGRCTVTAEVINTLINEEYLDDEGKANIADIEFISYNGLDKTYRVLGEAVGKAFDFNSDLL